MKRMMLSLLVTISFATYTVAQTPATQPLTQPAEQSHEGFEIRLDLRYLQYLPPGYADDPTDAKEGGHGWPLVIFLHGSGQRGTNLEVLKQEGLPKLVAEGRQYPFILLSPQVDLHARWFARDVVGIIDHAEKTLHVDPDRVIVTGLSMGGYGAWDVAALASNRLAGVVPICGGGNPHLAKYFTDLPIWAFHGADDDVVPLSQDLEMIEALKDAGAKNAKLTIYPGVGHPAWRVAYDDPKLFEWMLAQRRQPATQPTK